MFPQVSTLSVQGGATFNTVGGNQFNISNIANSSSSDDDLLQSSLKPVDSRRNVPTCMEGTRSDVFRKIYDWMDNLQVPNILWISGNPGVGKSAVASSIVSKLWERGRLGASFFFKRSDVFASDPAALWRTVAFDLARFDNAVKRSLVDILAQRPDPGTDIQLHFDFFITRPLSINQEKLVPRRPVIVIDAVDECGLDISHATQRRILLDTIAKWSRLSSAFKLIITSRDEPFSFRDSCYHISLETGTRVTAQTTHDIHIFLQRRLAEIATRFPSLPRSWPEDSTIVQLSNRAAGLFLWAETVVRVVEEDVPDKKLALILAGDFHGGESSIDLLYRQILDIAFKNMTGPQLATFKAVVGFVTLAKVPLSRRDIRYFIGRDETESAIDFILGKLSSVISIASPDGLIYVKHPSFSDFMCNVNHCPRPFFIRRDVHNQTLVLACFRLMNAQLKFNVCGLKTSDCRNDQIEPVQIEMTIPTSLSYSCLYWSHHLSQVKHESVLSKEVDTFLHVHFLHWLEVLSVLGQVSKAPTALCVLARWIGSSDAEASAFAIDALRFVTNFQAPISESAPQIYLSALPFSPQESKISRHFLPQFLRTLSVAEGREHHWPAILNILTGHTEAIYSVAYSPNGKLVVSGSGDKTICIWDVAINQIVLGPLHKHSDAVYSVTFSACGNFVASGSKDKTICIWNVNTGQIVSGPFKGHTKPVRSVAFFPSGKCIVSGAEDRHICIWDVKTGQLVLRPLEGHTRAVMSVGVSPDERYIVSGSVDTTICIWDIQSGQLMFGPFEVHTRAITTVAFSPEGDRVVTGSRDKTVSIWNPVTGERLLGPLIGHTDSVHCVAFSPKGNYIVSGSTDQTICIWDVQNGQVVAEPFKRHTGAVNTVVFSPNGEFIVSGSGDATIGVWDVQSRKIIPSSIENYKKITWSTTFSPNGHYVALGSEDGTICIWNIKHNQMTSFQAHENDIYSIAFSPDGMYIASASSDKTICIWSTKTYKMILPPFQGHKDWIFSISFSPSGEHIASGSQDNTVCIWNVKTGQMISDPLKEHKAAVYSVAFSPCNKYVASGSVDQSIYIWHVQAGQKLYGPFQCHGVVWSVTFSPDGRNVVSGLGNGTICVWNIESGQLEASPFKGHKSYVRSVAFSYDGKRIVSGSGDKTVCVWDIKTGQIVSGPFEGHTKAVWSVAFSPDGNYIVSSSIDKTLRVWNAKSPRLLEGHYLDFSNDWVYYGSQSDNTRNLLFWVPPVSQQGLCGEETMAIMGAHLTRLDLSKFAHSSSWTDCLTIA